MNHYAQVETGLSTEQLVCDLRSDTVTRPCANMIRAMASAPVGDDVYGDDPSVNKLEETMAGMLGKEAAMFVASGTQSNLCAVMAHCGRGEEVITGDGYHVFIDEAAGASVLAGVALFPIALEDNHSLLPERITGAIKDDDPHCPVSRLLCLENTVHGKAIDLETITSSSEAGRAGGLSIHLDGARFFNAVVETGCRPQELAGIADTVSVCLSKGLGAPMGSVLCGPHELVRRARRHRKILGGGMRQAGFAAAAGLYALENNIDRLAEDHARAGSFASFLEGLDAGAVEQATNMVFFTPKLEDHASLHAHLAKSGIKIGGQKPTIRMVMHRDVSDEAYKVLVRAFETFFRKN
ncbi:MAG: low-specificity L-threonine aldolase [Pseudomonadota bacterium]